MGSIDDPKLRKFTDTYWVVRDKASKRRVVIRVNPAIKDHEWAEDVCGPFKGDVSSARERKIKIDRLTLDDRPVKISSAS